MGLRERFPAAGAFVDPTGGTRSVDATAGAAIPSKLTRSAQESKPQNVSSPSGARAARTRGDRMEDWHPDLLIAALGHDGASDPWDSEASSGGSAPHGDPPRHSDPAVDRASALLHLSLAHLQILQTTLLSAYHDAVSAFDAAGAHAVAAQIVGGLRQMEQAHELVHEWVPQASHPGEPRTSAPVSSFGTAVGASSPETAELARLCAAFAEAVQLAISSLAVQLSPQLFGWAPVAGPPEPPSRAKVVHVGAELVAREAARVVELLEAVDRISALAMPEQDQASGAAAPDDLRSAVDELARFQSRPIDAAFLAKVLQARGVWQELAHARSHGGNRTAAGLLRGTQAQAAETGATADVGPKWNQDQAEGALSYGVTDWAVTDDDAMGVMEMLGAASPEARGGLVRQLHRQGLLERLVVNVGWQYIKQLAESLNDAEAEALLAPHWEGKGGVPSLGQLLQEQVARNRREGGWIDQSQAFAWDTLDRSLNVFTFGGKPAIDSAREALESGWISEDAYAVEACKAEVRAGLVGATSMATGGLAASWTEGAALAFGAGQGGSAVLSAAMAGATGNVGGQLAGDAFDQAFSGKQSFDSFSSYAQTLASGGLTAAAMAPVGLAAAKYLPAGTRTMAQQIAARHPEMVRVLEAARAAGMGTAFRVRMTVREWLTFTGGGGPLSGGGLQPAFAMAGVAPDLSSLPPDAELWITARPRADLSALASCLDDDTEPFFDVDFVEPVRRRSGHDRSGSLFDDPGATASYADDPFEHRPDLDHGPRATEADTEGTHALAERGTSVMSGNRLGISRPPRHHLLPQEEIAFFQARGFPGRDIDAYCVEVSQLEHDILHGGNQSLARRHWRQREWSTELMQRLKIDEAKLQRSEPGAKLSRRMILEIMEKLRARFEISDLSIVDYRDEFVPHEMRGDDASE